MGVIDRSFAASSEFLVSAGDTWGISGPEFLRLYVLFVVLAVLLGIWLRLRVTRGAIDNQGIAQPGSELSAPEVAMLFDDKRAVLTALAQLRSRDLIDSAAVPRRPMEQTDRQGLDPFTLSVYERITSGVKPTVASLTAGSSADVRQLRDSMIKRGYFPDADFRRKLWDAGLPVLIVGGVGVVRFIAGTLNDNPVAFLGLALLVQALCYWFLTGKPRLTPLGRLARTNAMRNNGHLRPSNSPAYATYGVNSAALAAAIFGGAALISLDPGFAQAVEPPSSSSGSDGGGGGSDGGGGGGCGGGGCGG
ncbi:TIGR04222 domain-containing membrane protein [Nocardia altamirensis]|uniref:TIGR04222 domain-containing membrane protein n=1 Tax=Nocardia altamirensis TaxID=472158 RepID=UPI00083FDB13|nr:TIGR04222 domain-containing membrane protein [Nocardia altamirensis]